MTPYEIDELISEAEIAALVAFLNTLTDEAFLDEDAFSDPFAN